MLSHLQENLIFIKRTEGRNTVLWNKIAKYYFFIFSKAKFSEMYLKPQLFPPRKQNALSLQREIIVFYSEK